MFPKFECLLKLEYLSNLKGNINSNSIFKFLNFYKWKLHVVYVIRIFHDEIIFQNFEICSTFFFAKVSAKDFFGQKYFLLKNIFLAKKLTRPKFTPKLQENLYKIPNFRFFQKFSLPYFYFKS